MQRGLDVRQDLRDGWVFSKLKSVVQDPSLRVFALYSVNQGQCIYSHDTDV